MPPDTSEIILTSNPKTVYLALSTPSMKTTIKPLAHVSPSFLLSPDQLWCFVVWPPQHGMAPPLRNCNKLSIQRQLSPNLLASPDLSKNKIYILKQF